MSVFRYAQVKLARLMYQKFSALETKHRNVINVFSPTDAKLNSLKNNIKFALKLTLKSSYMFRCETPSSGSIPCEPC